MMYALLLLWSLLLVPVHAWAACSSGPGAGAWTAASANSTVANDDVNDCITAAANGDTIYVPAGTVTWTKKILTQGKYFSLIGAGAGVTVVTDGVTDSGNSLLQLALNGAGLTRISGFTFLGNASTGPGLLQTTGSSDTFRFDHNAMTAGGSPLLQFYGCVHGVVDHNTITLSDGSGYFFYTKNGSGCLAGADDWGDEGWADGTVFSTGKAMFVEDNTITAPNDAGVWVGDGFQGGRYVFRFNTITNTNGLTGHGISSAGRYRGHRHAEYYSNTHTRSGAVLHAGSFAITSGTGWAFDNQISGQFQAFGDLQVYRDAGDYNPWTARAGEVAITSITFSGTTATVTTSAAHNILFAGNYTERVRITGATGGDATLYNGHFAVTNIDTTHFSYTMTGTPGANATGTLKMSIPWDGNTDQYGYPLLDQPGYGSGTELTNTYDPAPVATYPASGLAQSHEPVYAWNNTLGGTVTAMTAATSPNAVVENRDFYNQSATFDGTVGVGVGTLASRPATCTSGVGYWATDQGTWNTSSSNPYGVQRSGADGRLYLCTATDTWGATREPDTYPHALNTGGSGSSGPGKFTPSLNIKRADNGEVAMVTHE